MAEVEELEVVAGRGCLGLVLLAVVVEEYSRGVVELREHLKETVVRGELVTQGETILLVAHFLTVMPVLEEADGVLVEELAHRLVRLVVVVAEQLH
jgi:hypothetical protein